MLATYTLIASAVCFIVFWYVALVLHPKWMPSEPPRDKNGVIVGRSSRGGLLALGLVEALLFLGGTLFLTAGATQIGTAIGYASL